MRIRPSILLNLLVGLACLPSHVHASDIPERDSLPVVTETAGSIRFDLYQGYFIVVHGSIGRLKNLNFFLDTGTTPSVVDARIAKSIDLPTEKSISIAVLGGRTEGHEAHLSSIELGPLKRSNLHVITTDLSFFQKFFPVRIDAIVGMDVLGQGPFVIDYSAREIRFGAAPHLPVSVPLRLDQGMAVFEVEIDHTPVHLVFDTGAGSIILFNRVTPQSPEVKDAALLAPKRIGDFESKQVRLHTLRLGPEEFRRKSALMTGNPKPSQLDYDGLLSPASLGISQVSVDLKGGRMTFTR
ncbi:MAG: aspartyl protease family protein [Terracidiphilus sp.]